MLRRGRDRAIASVRSESQVHMDLATRDGPNFAKYLTIYHKIILSLSQDRLTIVTYSVLSFSYECRKVNYEQSPTILQVNRT